MSDNVLGSAREMRDRLRAWLERLKATPSPKPQTPEPPKRKPKRPKPRRLPLKPINDAALRAEYAARWKQLVENARRQIEQAREAIVALRRTLGSFTDEEAVRWYWPRYNYLKETTAKDISKARDAYRKYLLAQIKYYEGIAKSSPEALAKQKLGGFL